MTKRTIIPATVAAVVLAWTGVASADVVDDASKKTTDTTKKATDTTKKVTDSAGKPCDCPSKGSAGAKKAVDDTATKTTTTKTTQKTKSGVDKASADAANTADVATSKTETTAANVFTAERPEKRGPNKPLLYASGGALALSYVPAAIVGLASPKNTDSWMAVPVVGPWIALGTGSDERQWTGDVAIAADGVIQGAAALGMVAAFVVPDAKLPMGLNSKLRVTPTTMGKDGYGVGAGGVF